MLLALAPSARGESDLAVVNAAGDARARSAAAGRVAALRARLVQAKAAREIPAELRGVLEAGAQPPSPQPYAPSMEPARQAYAAFSYEEAQRLLERETERVLAQTATAELPAALARLCFWRGKVAVAQAERAASERWFGCALALAPSWSPDPATEPPQVQRAFARVMRKRARPGRGTLRVESAPPGAELTLDGAPIGRAPVAQGSLAPGMHLLVVDQAGRKRRAELVEVAAKGITEHRVELVELPMAERAARALERAVAPAEGTGERTAALAEIAAMVGVSKLLLVEGGEGGALEARLVDVGAGTASAPVALSSEGVPRELAALIGLETPPAVAAATNTDRPETEAEPPALDLTAPPPPRRTRRPWYRSSYLWLGFTAAAVAAAGAIWVAGDTSPHFSCCASPEP